MIARALSLSLAAALGLLAGCANQLVATPDRFVALEQRGRIYYDYRATSADGVVIAVRALEIDRDQGGDLQFWVDAVELRLRQLGGYALLSTSDVTTGKGLDGKQLSFGRDEKQHPYRYTVTVFLTAHQLLVVEAGGPEKKFVARQDHIATAIASLDP